MLKGIENLRNKNIHIVGLSGAEGSAIVDFLFNQGINKNITGHDFSCDKEELRKNFFKTHLNIPPSEREKEFKGILELPIKINYKDKYLDGIWDADIIFVPQSWHLYEPNFPILAQAKEKGITFSSITKLYFDLAPCPIISITGTKGKGTTAKLIYEILLRHNLSLRAPTCRGEAIPPFIQKRSRLLRRSDAIIAPRNDTVGKVYFAGNDRQNIQVLKDLPDMTKEDVLILETSNRQLMIKLGKSPKIAVITNISPDHIDEHGSYANYIKTKRKLIKYQREGDFAVLNYDNDITRGFIKEFPKTSFPFSRLVQLGKGAFVRNNKIIIKTEEKESEICNLSDIKIPGLHNVENVLAAAAATFLFGVEPRIIKEGIRNFKGLRHRIEFIGEFDGVKFYDDLASTNPESTIAAIETLKNYPLPTTNYPLQTTNYNLILIAGGDDKGMDYRNLAKMILEKVDLLILLPGSGTNKIKNQKSPKDKPTGQAKIKNTNQKLKIFECKNFNEALNIIKKQIKKGDIVLISPGCAHFQSRFIDSSGKNLRGWIKEIFENTKN